MKLQQLTTYGLQLITVFLFLITCPFFLSSCKNNLDEARLVTSRVNVNIENGKDINIVYSSLGENKIKASAPTVHRFNTEKPYMTFPEGIKVDFYTAEGIVGTTMTAKYATVQDGSSLMTARNDVVVINEKGEKLNTEELIWDESREQIYSNDFVKITTEDEIIMGNGMESNQTFTDYTIKRVTGRIKVKAEE